MKIHWFELVLVLQDESLLPKRETAHAADFMI